VVGQIEATIVVGTILKVDDHQLWFGVAHLRIAADDGIASAIRVL
jgi:hypothetical protein